MGDLLQAGSNVARGLPAVTPAIVAVLMLACVLVPLPTWVVDLLLSMSLAGAVLLVAASLTVPRTAEFSSFPALLLQVTLFRLALNVSTTRLILSQADAGRVVDAFASTVVRGDLIVGGVMFAIVTVVQYGVIARGAERVAEVGARFALDGLPGHQAAIEADLRAGVISAREASRRRQALTERSNFYGAMDGAVRFVRGDAVAGIVITTINLLGGVAIGSGRGDLSWAESFALYGQLTIGDGLLAQIPALLVSVAAGVLVARVDRERTGEGHAQTWLQPAMLLVPAGLLAVLAAVPGMPALVFACTAAALGAAAGGWAMRSVPKATPEGMRAESQSILVWLHPARAPDPGQLERSLAEVRGRCRATLAISIPPIELRLTERVPEDALDVVVLGRPCARAPHSGASPDAVVLAVFRAVMDAAPHLIDLEVLSEMVERVRNTHPVVVERALAHVELVDVLGVVRGFLRDRVRVPPLPAVLGLLAEDPRFHDRVERPRMPELARQSLVAHWVFAELDGLQRLGPLRFVRTTPDVEERMLARVSWGRGGPRSNVPAADRERWARAIARAASQQGSRGVVIVVATPPGRAGVAAVLQGVHPRIPVLSTEELEHAGGRPEGPWLDEADLENA